LRLAPTRPCAPARESLWPALAAAAAAAAVYGATLCPTVYAEGSGELIGATYLLGTAHPTGYPLYCLLGRLFCALAPLASPALEVNAFTGLTGAAAVGLLVAWLGSRGLGAWSAVAGGLLWAFSATFWSQCVISEVYGLAAALALLVVGAATGRLDSPRRLALLGLLMGLGATAHLQVILLYPAVLWLALRGGSAAREPSGVAPSGGAAAAVATWWRRVTWLAGGAGLGYSSVLYLILRNGRGSAFHWSEISTAVDLWEHVTGSLYSSSFFALPAAAVAGNAARWLDLVRADLHPLLGPAILWGLWVWWRRDRSSLGLWASGAALNLVTGLQYHRDPTGFGVFFLVTLMTATIAATHAIDDLAGRVRRRCGGQPRLALVALVPVAAVLVNNWDRSDHGARTLARTYGEDVLRGLPADAVLVTEGDHVSYVADYLWRVEGMRPDVLVVNRLGRGGGGPGGRWAAADQAAWERRHILAGARPVCYTSPRAMPVPEWEFAPAGLVYRAVPADRAPGAAHTFPDSLLRRARTPAPDAWSRRLQAEYWFMRGEFLGQTGQSAAAVAAYEAAADRAPQSRTVRFNVAVKLLRHNNLKSALEHARAAVEIDPVQVQPRRLAAAIQRYLGRRAAGPSSAP